MKIVLPNEKPMSLNKFYSGMHWTDRKIESDRVHTLVRYSKVIPQPNLWVEGQPLKIIITAYFKNRPYDSDNIVAKLYIDGLKGHLIKNDSPEFIESVTTKSMVDKENPRVEIEIL